jgi:hypothetical protein
MDDVTVLTNIECIPILVPICQRWYQWAGQTLNLQKSHILSKSTNRSHTLAAQAALRGGLVVTGDTLSQLPVEWGIVSLGIPLGTPEFVRRKLDEKFQEIYELRSLWSKIRLQQDKFLLLRNSIFHKVTYLTRSLGPMHLKDWSEKMDALLIDMACETGGLNYNRAYNVLSDTGRKNLWRQLQLGTNFGGIGLTSTWTTALSGYLGMVALFFEQKLPDVFDFVEEAYDLDLCDDSCPGGFMVESLRCIVRAMNDQGISKNSFIHLVEVSTEESDKFTIRDFKRAKSSMTQSSLTKSISVQLANQLVDSCLRDLESANVSAQVKQECAIRLDSIRVARGAEAATVFTKLPTHSQRVLDNETFQTMFHLRFNLQPGDVFEIGCACPHCQSEIEVSNGLCEGLLARFPARHLATCKSNNVSAARNAPHNAVVNLIKDLFDRYTRYTTMKEVVIGTTDNKRMDLLISDGKSTTAIDVTTVDDTVPSFETQRAGVVNTLIESVGEVDCDGLLIHCRITPGLGCSLAEKRKMDKYRGLCDRLGYEFTPFAVELGGGLGQLGLNFITSIRDDSLMRPGLSAKNFRYLLRTAISFELAKFVHVGLKEAIRSTSQKVVKQHLRLGSRSSNRCG